MTAPSATASASWPQARTLAAAAALAVALAGRGDLLFLGALLALALADRRSSLAAALAMTAVALRWGTTSLQSVTGAVTTLGPALRVGPPQAAAAVLLAAAALLLAGVRAPLLPRLAAGLSAGAVALGPVGASSGGAVVLGLVGAAVGAALAVVLHRMVPDASDRWSLVAIGAAVVALALGAIW